jgi:hypothetical protein
MPAAMAEKTRDLQRIRGIRSKCSGKANARRDRSWICTRQIPSIYGKLAYSCQHGNDNKTDLTDV